MTAAVPAEADGQIQFRGVATPSRVCGPQSSLPLLLLHPNSPQIHLPMDRREQQAQNPYLSLRQASCSTQTPLNMFTLGEQVQGLGLPLGVCTV